MSPFHLSPHGLLYLVLAAILGLIVLIVRFRCNAFVAILIASLVVGLGSGMPVNQVAGTFEAGVGATLGSLGMIIGLGTILGKMLAESGGAEVIARTMITFFGVKRLDYALMVLGFMVGISVFFNVGILLLGPIAFTLARETRIPILRLALPLAAGLSVAHGLIPPHPGPMAAIVTIHANTGKTILWSLLFGLPTALITGPLLVRKVAPYVPVEIGGLGRQSAAGGAMASAPRPPGFAVSLITMLLPVGLMLLATLAQVVLPPESSLLPWAQFFGSGTVALLIAVLVSFWTFGRNCGFDARQILKFSEQCLAPAAGLFLLIGAGGGFSRVLKESGVGAAVAGLVPDHAGPSFLLLLGWTFAGLLRISTGSATVSVSMAAGFMLPIIEQPGVQVNRELLVLAMGSGSLILSHVNDSGFWFIKEYLGMSVSQTLRTWTVVETGIAVTSLALILLGSLVIH